jgi:nitrate reductase cytochrome c-type subunit
MHHHFFALVLTIAIVAGTGCEQIKTQANPGIDAETQTGSETITTAQSFADDQPPLLLDDEPPLLLNDASNAKTGADNSRCFVCHINYMQESLAVSHAQANIGCKDCHGESDAHIADESWASGGTGTPPEVMYPRAKINPACMACHPEGRISADQHQSVLAGTAQKSVCTDCHGNHRLNNRRCKWK